MKISKFPFFLLLIVFALSSCKATKRVSQVDLKIDLKKGQVLTLKNDIKQIITQSMMGMENVINQDIGLVYDMKVDDIVDGNFDMTVTYTRATFVTNNPMGAVDYDSEVEEQEIPPLALGYAAIVDKSFKIRMNPKGKVIEVSELDSFMEQTIKTINELNPELGPQIAEGMEEQFGEDALKKSVENMVIYYPKKPVKVGEIWEQSYSVKQGRGFEMFVDNTYTLERIEDGKIYLNVVAKVHTDEDATMEMQGMTMIYALAGDQGGNFVLDQKTGWVLESTLDQNIEGNMNISGGQLPQPMDIPMGIKTNTVTVWMK